MDKRFIQKVRRRDRIATRVITVGGLAIIASVIGILLLIVKVTLPLFRPARAELLHRQPLGPVPARSVRAVGVGDYQEVAFSLDDSGVVTFYRLADGSVIKQVPVGREPGHHLQGLDNYQHSIYSLLWDDGRVTVCQVDYKLHFDPEGHRTVVPSVTVIRELAAGNYPAPVRAEATRQSEEGRFTRVALLADNRFAIEHQVESEDLFGNRTRETFSFLITEEIPGRITAFTLDEQGLALFAGTDQGSLLRWDLSENDAYHRTDNVVAVPGGKPVTALTMVFGDVSVAVAGGDGSFATWMPVRTGGESKKLRRIHVLKPKPAPVTSIIASRRTKTLVSLDREGRVHFDHMTSENHLLDIDGHLTLAGLAGRDNSLVGLDRDGKLVTWNIDDPHPEISWKTLFGKVWYEGYDQPAYVWQSTGGSDEFEPKFSIVPLLFGTIKGTLYAMLFAVPLAIFGAVYTSQCSIHFFKRAIKPTIEVMASVPSVVIGFLIALWLAPIVENTVLALLLSLVMVPAVFVVFMVLLQPLCQQPPIQNRLKGYEFLIVVPVLILAGAFSLYLAPVLERAFFDGNFKQWLFEAMGTRYDQRNCIIIAFGLGIAVIPIIFSITEDAITNIPPSLTAASLALGASRWQTIWRVVLPSASPGIFAAIMIGFGRAVGETMIVLMATGNTPIMDWSIFNGMRTLSANIAVEIPEAPVDGTLYRVLFLCATLLFLLTFILNTGAELVRERLRKKYGRY